MSLSINLPLILAAAFVSTASPGPATLAIADTAMQAGRRAGLTLALGVVTGSLAWSIAAALGLAAVMASSAWALDLLRYAGGAYLMILALKSARNAITGAPEAAPGRASPSRNYVKGLALHLTNPKAILFFGSLYTLGLSAQTTHAELALVIAAVGLQSTLIFTGYAWAFSNRRMAQGYRRLRRWFDGVFAVLFAGASLKILAARLTP
ncbi:LysE family translocator [Methylobacterium sp. Gmos1]